MNSEKKHNRQAIIDNEWKSMFPQKDVNYFIHSWNNNLLDKLCETQNDKKIFYNSNIIINQTNNFIYPSTII